MDMNGAVASKTRLFGDISKHHHAPWLWLQSGLEVLVVLICFKMLFRDETAKQRMWCLTVHQFDQDLGTLGTPVGPLGRQVSWTSMATHRSNLQLLSTRCCGSWPCWRRDCQGNSGWMPAIMVTQNGFGRLVCFVGIGMFFYSRKICFSILWFVHSFGMISVDLSQGCCMWHIVHENFWCTVCMHP